MIPYPPNDGGTLCTFGLIDYLRKFHDIQILLISASIKDKDNIEALIKKWPDVTIHRVDLFKENKHPVKRKFLDFIKNTIKEAYQLANSLTTKSIPAEDVYSRYDTNYSLPFAPHPEPFVKKLSAIINENKFHIIQAESTSMLNLVNLFPPGVKKIYLQIEGRGEILYDYGLANNFDPTYIKHVAGNASFLEYTYMNQYDAVLALNEKDKINIEQNVSPQVKVFSSPFGILDADIKEPDMDNYKAENLIFLGSEYHYPNFDGLNWFLTDVLPKFKQFPFKKLYITSQWSEETIKRYQELTDRVCFIGFVNDLTPYLKNSISIVPIRIGGGGIRTKILSAMHQGSPVVATSLAAVGIKGRHQKEILIADTANDFALAVDRFFTDNEFARTVGKNAYQLIINEYSQSKVGEIRNTIYNKICDK